MIIGNIIQVFHIILLVVFAYFTGRKPWVGFTGLSIIIIGQLICDNYCPLTALSNVFLEGAGRKGYPDLFHWSKDFLGFYGAFIFYSFVLLVPFTIGLMFRLK